jgi:PadR family transcriptional regulator PadR
MLLRRPAPYVRLLPMPEPVRMTITVAAILRIFLDDITQPRYGYELMRATGYPSGKLYPVLARLERAGWLIKEFEDIDPTAEGRPARRLYRLSAEAVPAARSELAALTARLQPSARQPRRLRPQGGLA